ncbi:hypothetical protein INT45_012076, partial [Circinella minor]
QWTKLQQTPIWKYIVQQHNNPSKNELKSAIHQHRANNLTSILTDTTRSKTLAVNRPRLGVDPIMWMPMSNKDRSRCIRWRIGWLPGGKPKQCIKCNNSTFTKYHATYCLSLHQQLNINQRHTNDPLSSFLNKLPKSKPPSSSRINYLTQTWPIVYQILAKLDTCQHPSTNQQQYLDPQPGQAYIK